MDSRQLFTVVQVCYVLNSNYLAHSGVLPSFGCLHFTSVFLISGCLHFTKTTRALIVCNLCFPSLMILYLQAKVVFLMHGIISHKLVCHITPRNI